MSSAAFRNTSLSVGASVVIGASLVLGAFGAQAQQADSSTGLSNTLPTVPGATGRQTWRISDYTTVQLVAREPGSPANSHPLQIEPSTLQAILKSVEVLRAGAGKPLFGNGELNDLVSALTEALGHARPDQDIAIVSSARHDDNTFFGLTAVTARLFVLDDHINLIVHDARYDFYDKARGSGNAPSFTLGSRTDVGSATLQSVNGTNRRADWLVLAEAPLSPARAAAPVVPAPAVVAPAAVAPAVPAAPSVPPAAAAAPAPVFVPTAPATPSVVTPAPAAPAAAPGAEQRLTTLKRLYDKGLITKPEYEKKRQEILKDL